MEVCFSFALRLIMAQYLHKYGDDFTFLGAFEKLQKTIVSFVMSVRPSVRIEQLDYRWMEFHEI
jgi:hypothetical protein